MTPMAKNKIIEIDSMPSLSMHPTESVFSIENSVDMGIQKLIDKNENKNTKKSTNNWIAKFGKWAEANGIHFYRL